MNVSPHSRYVDDCLAGVEEAAICSFIDKLKRNVGLGIDRLTKDWEAVSCD